MSGEATFLRMPRSKPKTSAEGQEQLSHSLARMASAPVAGKRVPITEVGFGQCRFVIDDRSFPALCCGEPTLGGSWCAQHRALVFVRVAAAPNHRKAPEAETAPNGPAKPDVQAKRPDKGKPPAPNGQKLTAERVSPSGQRADMPAKVAKPPEKAPVKKDRAGQGGARKESTAGTRKVEGKRAEAAPAKRTDRPGPAKKPEPRKTAMPSPRSKTAPARKSAAKRTAAAAKKAPAKAKGHAAKRPPPAKKSVARKGTSAKGAASAKKSAARKKGKAR